jgi:hypothetical protein
MFVGAQFDVCTEFNVSSARACPCLHLLPILLVTTPHEAIFLVVTVIKFSLCCQML